MHIPDGYLGPETYGGLWAIMVPIWMVASKKVKQSLEATRVPYLAMASAFSLVAMMFTIPLPGGTTGHITGSTLVAVLLGPWAALLAVSVALMIQALVFGDGGITSIGANCFNIAFIGAMVGYGIYRFITRIGRPFIKQPPDNEKKFGASNLFLHLTGAGIASYLSINLGGLFTAIELGLQPLLHSGGSGASLYFPFPLKMAIPAVMIPHLTAVGLLEVTVTVLVLLIIFKSQPALVSRMKTICFVLMFIFIAVFPTLVFAHDFWIEKKGNDFMVVYGHGSQRLEFEPTKIKTVKAFDFRGKEVEVTKEKKATGVLLKPIESPSLFFVEIDDGYWSKTIYGWKNLPKTKASRVVESFRSFYYSKALLSWGEAAQRPLSDAKLDLLPLENPFELKEGNVLSIRVLYQGKPISELEVEGGDHKKITTTDKEGVAKLKISKGHQVFSVNYKEPIKNDPDADLLRITSTLTFEVTK
ncbi:MAG: cobalt transporter CbiM [Syntrophaceae bacterium]|nr:cobalt transporter CbiM [Syntrophaceae bacterium]